MGSMSEELAASMLRGFMTAALDQQIQREEDLARRMSAAPTWRWAPGTFVFPEGLCCYCSGVMQSRAIWRAVGLQYYGSWKVVGDGGEGHFEYDDSHPHVNQGSICMGKGNNRAPSLSDALFLSFNPVSTYFGSIEDPDTGEVIGTNARIKAWFADRFDHVCGRTRNTKTLGGVNLAHMLSSVEGCHCPFCRRAHGEVQCPRPECGEWYVPRIGHGNFTCKVCSPRRGIRYCVKHQHVRHECTACKDIFDFWDMESGQLYDPPPIAQCAGCGEWVCDHCASPEAGNYQHKCAEPPEVVEVDAEEEPTVDDEGDCTHSCCVDCCRAAGCEDLEAQWPEAFEDDDDEDAEDTDEEF